MHAHSAINAHSAHSALTVQSETSANGGQATFPPPAFNWPVHFHSSLKIDVDDGDDDADDGDDDDDDKIPTLSKMCFGSSP